MKVRFLRRVLEIFCVVAVMLRVMLVAGGGW